MTDSQQLANTTIPLHPRQVAELNDTKARLAGVLQEPDYVRRQLADQGEGVRRQMRDIDRVLQQAPKPYEAGEVDDAVRLEGELRSQWLQGMPTHAEMRRNPAGAVDKHRAWDDRNKTAVLMWKHLRRRLHATGISDARLADEGDISNVERYRPTGGSAELNMHNEQIEGRSQFGPVPGAGPAVVFTEPELTKLRLVDPELSQHLGTLTNEQRQMIADVLRGVSRPEARREAEPVPVPPTRPGSAELKRPLGRKKRRKKAQMSPERRLALSERMKAMNEHRRAAKAAEAQTET